MELAAPLRIVQETGAGLQVICQRMTLGPADASGRARPVPLAGSEFGIPVDSVITALGQQIAGELGMLASTPSDQGEFSTFYGNVLIGGDAKRGASTVIKAIADGKHAADAIVGRSVPATSGSSTASDPGKLQQHAATRIKRDPCPELPLDRRGGFDPVMPLLDEKAVHAEAARCLSCDLSCNVCVTVCPNRANVNYQVKPAIYEAFVLNRAESARPQARQSHPVAIQQAEQVINIGNFCNECGNCATFCPTAGAPYRDKPKVYLDEASFTAEQDGFLLTSSAIFMRRDGMCFQLTDKQEHFHYDTADFSVTLRKHDLMPLADSLVFKNDSAMSADTHPAIAMAILWQGLSRKSFVFDHK